MIIKTLDTGCQVALLKMWYQFIFLLAVYKIACLMASSLRFVGLQK